MQRRKLSWALYINLFFIFSLVFHPIASAEEVMGFRGIKWGDPLPKDGLKVIEKKQFAGKQLTSYKRASDKLDIGSAKVKSITYLFWDGRFYSVVIDCTGGDNYRALLNAFKERLGSPAKSDDDDFFAWFGGTTNAYLRCRYTLNLKYDFFLKAEAKLVSEVISKEMAAWEKDQAVKGKSDFDNF